MVDFDKLRKTKPKTNVVEPIELFRRLPKPGGINDLYTSQAEVLNAWHKRRAEKDVVIKLHTGGGKTLVGLLIAQSTLNETRQPVLYLTPTLQLVNQTLEKAKSLKIPAVPYTKGQSLHDDFVNANAVMVSTYQALFNGKSKFRIRGIGHPQNVAAVILDDAHVAFASVRDSFTLDVESRNNRELYESLCGPFRESFREIDRLGTFDDVLAGNEFAVLEVPYWSWHEKLEVVRELLKASEMSQGFQWPLIRDRLHLCHALISKDRFTLTPIVPMVDMFPTFEEADRRIYMSATIADDSDIIRTFNASPESVAKPLESRSLAGISERMLLIPDLMPFGVDIKKCIVQLSNWVASQKMGAVMLVASDSSAEEWQDSMTLALGSHNVEAMVEKLQSCTFFGPVVFSNRYDGIDLPGDSCRFLVLKGLPIGTSNYELFRATTLHGGESISRMIAQRIEQGIGRGARGAGDYCVVLLAGSDIAGWIAKDANYRLLTEATKAQLEMGMEISRAITDPTDLVETIKRSFSRDLDWVQYHAETLAERLDEATTPSADFKIVETERKAISLWQDGHTEKAINKITSFLSDSKNQLDRANQSWMKQLAARIAHHSDNMSLADDLQGDAYALNRNLFRPKKRVNYVPLQLPGNQAKLIVEQLSKYRIRRGFLRRFDDLASNLHNEASANQFEQALLELGEMLGFVCERHDDNGEGPDVLWLLSNNTGFVFEAKSRKKRKNGLNKDDHGQLLIAGEWFKRNYPNHTCVRISVLPNNRASSVAEATESWALTFASLTSLIGDARHLFRQLSESLSTGDKLLQECESLIGSSRLAAEQIARAYLTKFVMN